jgi:EAL domain-containing protein (putative c-di-GMP-specific phosphodiesterase class I)
MPVALVERVAFEADLRAAVAAGGISMHLQPVFEIDGGAIVGAEALARWSHPERGMVPPAMFIPVAEETGLIVEIGRQILVDACREASRWAVVEGSPLAVNVNVSAVQLAGSGLVDDVRRALDLSGLAPELLTLEITESVLADDTRKVHTRLEELKALGIRLSIDDFGTGYSSLSYLQTFPVDEIKIDRSFVAKLSPEDRDGHVFVRAIVELARGLGLDTVAEGIERTDQLEVLRQLGCKLGQGYLVARPMEPAEFEAFVVDAAA